MSGNKAEGCNVIFQHTVALYISDLGVFESTKCNVGVPLLDTISLYVLA
jgi:hypothetical protein